MTIGLLVVKAAAALSMHASYSSGSTGLIVKSAFSTLTIGEQRVDRASCLLGRA